MAVTYRFPVLVWKDHAGWYTASLLEWDEPAGFGHSADVALAQVQEYLDWRYRDNPWAEKPDFLDPQLIAVKVPVRPEYQVEGRRYPCDESVTLRVWCVHGRQEQGLLVCVLPTLDMRFYYYDDFSLRPLVTHYVQQKLEGITPQGLARHLPSDSVSLEQVVVTLNRRESRGGYWIPDLDSLQQIAEPIGDPRFRKMLARPWHRDREVNDLVRRLSEEKANVLLVGEPGSGKTTILVEAVRLIERQQAEKEDRPRKGLAARLYWLTSGARLISGMKYLGQWEERCEMIIAELAQLGGTLCIDSLLDLIREGGDGSADSIASFFLPYLQRGELRIVGEATPAELDACRRLLPGFADVFQVLRLEPFSRGDAVSVLDHLSDMLRQNNPIEFGQGVTDLIYNLHSRFLPYHAFPGRAAGFVMHLFDRVRQESKPTREKPAEITTERVVREFVRQTGLPELFLRDQLTLGRDDVEEAFRKQVIGQEAAVKAAAGLVMAFKAGMNDPNRPVGVLLFCGPTGVGKTEMAKALSRYFFGHGESGDRLVRLDMSEYSGHGAADRLLSKPNGQPSDLIQKLRQQPFVVLLLDEIEKADPEVFDVLLGVFDEGRLTDRYGRLTTFRSAIIVLTSNLGAGKQEAFGFAKKSGVAYESEAISFFRPEFFNRLDAVVTFQPLAPETIRAITRKELADVAQREGIARLNLKLTWSEALIEHLAREGFDARYGARPLQRTIETLIVTPLARYLLEHPETSNTTLHTDLGVKSNVEFQQRP
jgi:ATP-dependent Clp protease ATP-binding subunit ClpC